jgi:outer membrane protein insertion porin family
VAVAPPLPGFIQYHKWDLNTAWYTPITARTAFSVRTQFGYVGSLNDEDVQFQRYLVGGSPLDVQSNFRGFGKDLVFLRGYPLEVVGLSLAPYLFAEAANTYDSFDAFDPARLYRSAGVGLRVFLPILGLVDLNYGYQIDPYVPLGAGSDDDGLPKWRFQFSLGGQ